MAKYIIIIVLCLLNGGCNNLLLFDLEVTENGIKPEIKSAYLYIDIDNCADRKVLDKALQNNIIKIRKKSCFTTADDGTKAEYEVPLTITDNWLNTDSISIISNKNTFLTIKIPYKTIKMFKDKMNYHSSYFPLFNEYPVINISITLKGVKNLKLGANSVYFNSSPIANGVINLEEGRRATIVLSKIAAEQLFNTGQVTILSRTAASE